MLKCESDGKLVITLSVSLLSSYACDPAGCQAARGRTKLGFISRSGYRSQAVTIVSSPFSPAAEVPGALCEHCTVRGRPRPWDNEATSVSDDSHVTRQLMSRRTGEISVWLSMSWALSSWDAPRSQLFIKLFLKLVLCAALVNGSGLNGWKPK